MHYLSEDPWPLVAILGLVALGYFLALWLTQQGRYLVRAGIATGLALTVLVIEALWVTDNERIERTVYALARAVEASDTDAVEALLAPEVVTVVQDRTVPHGITLHALRMELRRTKFDFVRITNLKAQAHPLSRTGTAEFRAYASGTTQRDNTMNFAIPPDGTEWSLGFRETRPGEWKVTRITPTRLPRQVHFPEAGL
jgi:ketosteroid isomerase-like protein